MYRRITTTLALRDEENHYTATTSVEKESTTTDSVVMDYGCSSTSLASVSISEVVAWVLVSILTVLFTGLLTVSMLWFCKKKYTRHIDGRTTKYEMEDNPCYEATTAKQTTDTEKHLYETVKGRQAKLQ